MTRLPANYMANNVIHHGRHARKSQLFVDFTYIITKNTVEGGLTSVEIRHSLNE